MNTVKQVVLHRIRKANPENMSEAILKARERHGKPFSFESGSSWKPHDTPVLTAWLQSKGEKK
jgi:hypothetical protein